MIMMRKSMISAVTAAVLVTGFTGCSSDTTNVTEPSNSTSTSTSTSTTGGNNSVITNPKGTVTGTVMDTNGNPIANVAVGLAGMNATTDASGIYVFNEVPVVNTTNAAATVANVNVLQVTITAPDGYMGATVTVAPNAQQISSGDQSAADAQTNPNTNFIDGYLAQAGTAVLPKLGAVVTGRLELAATEASVTNTNIALDFRFVGGITGGNVAQVQDGVVTTYATGNYSTTTDADGFFRFENLPADSSLAYVVGNYTVVGEQVAQGGSVFSVSTGFENDVINVGDVQVAPVVNSDVTSPMVVSVVEGLNPNSNATLRMMLVDDARTEFTLNLSEAIAADSDGTALPDTDMTDSVNVYVGALGAMQKVAASAVYSGTQLTVTLPEALTDGQLIDVHLINADFRDMANNFIALNPAIGYDFATSNVTTAVNLQAFNDLNLNAPAVTDFAQQIQDDNGVDDEPLLVQASNAFNDTVDNLAGIQQMNSSDDDNGDFVNDASARLVGLANAITGGPVLIDADVPRVTFTPSNAASYVIALSRNGANVVVTAANMVLEGDPAGTQLTDNLLTGDVVYTPADPADVTSVEFALLTAVNVRVDDILTITPRDDLGYNGTPTVLTIQDNVLPTTVLQPSYGLSNGVNGNNTVVQFGDGGELAQNSGAITPGLPYLAVTAGLLDNLDAAGNTVTGVAPRVPNARLDHELAAYDKAFDHDADATTADQSLFDLGFKNVYDSTAYPLMPKNRTIGVAFSEDIELNGVTPAVTGVATTLNAWKVNNDVTYNADGVVNNVDLIDMDSSNVIELANADDNGVIDYTGIKDNAGNVADAETNAKVVLQDKMPPFVKNARFNGENVIIVFNENVSLRNGVDTVIINGKTATADAANWVVANNKVTIDATDFVPALIKADFNMGSYAEVAYGADEHQHAQMTWTVGDLAGNNWATANAGVVPPRFAAVETIGNFAAATNNSGYNVAAVAGVAQTVKWTFNHQVVTGAGELFNACGSTLAEPANAALIDSYFEHVDGTNVTTPLTAQYTDVKITLDSACKVMTLTFETPSGVVSGDKVRNVGGAEFTSVIDNAQKEDVSAAANN